VELDLFLLLHDLELDRFATDEIIAQSCGEWTGRLHLRLSLSFEISRVDPNLQASPASNQARTVANSTQNKIIGIPEG